MQGLIRAAPLIAERGLHATTIDDIVAASGITKTTLYYYLDGKEEILRWLLDDQWQRLTSALADVADPTADPLTRLRNVLHAYLDSVAEYPGASLAISRELRFATGDANVGRWESVVLEPVTAIVRDGCAQGVFAATIDAVLVATVLYGAANFAALRLIVMTGSIADRGALASEISDLVLPGLCSDQDTTPAASS
jgi:AcrR family transcriptional regulator